MNLCKYLILILYFDESDSKELQFKHDKIKILTIERLLNIKYEIEIALYMPYYFSSW